MKTFDLVTGKFYLYSQTIPYHYSKLLKFVRPCEHCNAYLFYHHKDKIYQLDSYMINDKVRPLDEVPFHELATAIQKEVLSEDDLINVLAEYRASSKGKVSYGEK